MSFTWLRSAVALAGALAAMGLGASASAAPVFCGTNKICYDDVVLPGASFTGINETVQTADDFPATANDGLYGEPTGIGGDTLFFDPDSYDATSTSGSGLDQTHSLLNATISASEITTITLTENGDYTFGGFGGTAATGVQQTIAGSLTVLDATNALLIGEIINIDNVVDLAGSSESFNVSSTGTITQIPGGFTASFTDGVGTENWEIEWVLDLTGLGITELELQLDNIQFANSEASTSASIFKKVSLTVVPEPATGSLLALGLVGLAAARRRARR